jgi:hypothetical protein
VTARTALRRIDLPVVNKVHGFLLKFFGIGALPIKIVNLLRRTDVFLRVTVTL